MARAKRFTVTGADAAGWQEYDALAEHCAVRHLDGAIGTPLPANVSARVMAEINADPEAFAARVRGIAYMLAMNTHDDHVFTAGEGPLRPYCAVCGSSETDHRD